MATVTLMQSTRPMRGRPGGPSAVPTRSVAACVPMGAHAQRPAPSLQSAVVNTPVRLTRRGRLVVSIASAFLTAAAGAAIVTLATGADVQASSTTSTYTVQPGDTLWAIAGRINPGADRRDTVATLLRLNPAASGGLSAGESLEVPQQ